MRINIENATLDNKYYRRVLYTTPPNMQLVVMSLVKNQTIPCEQHNGTQFIRVEQGRGVAKIQGQKTVRLAEGVALMIPPNTRHEIKATSDLKLYTLYSPPQHAPDAIEI